MKHFKIMNLKQNSLDPSFQESRVYGQMNGKEITDRQASKSANQSSFDVNNMM